MNIFSGISRKRLIIFGVILLIFMSPGFFEAVNNANKERKEIKERNKRESFESYCHDLDRAYYYLMCKKMGSATTDELKSLIYYIEKVKAKEEENPDYYQKYIDKQKMDKRWE